MAPAHPRLTSHLEEANVDGYLVDAAGYLVDAAGYLVEVDGYLVDADGDDGVLVANDLRKESGGLVAVDDLSFAVQEQEIPGIIGAAVAHRPRVRHPVRREDRRGLARGDQERLHGPGGVPRG